MTPVNFRSPSPPIPPSVRYHRRHGNLKNGLQAYDEDSISLTCSASLANRLSGMAAALIIAARALGFSVPLARAEEARIALHRPFALIDADGKTVKSTDFSDKWLLIYFGYTHCSDQCPTALSAIAEALDEIGPAARYVQPLFITVDPERDRGLMLRDFTAAFNKRLIGLTGTQEQIADVAHSLGVKYEKVLLDNSDYVIDHSTVLSVVDPSGRSAVTFTLAEPCMIAAKLFDLLDRSGVPLGIVNNRGAYH